MLPHCLKAPPPPLWPSLEQTLTVEAASLESEVTDETAMPVAPSPSGEHTAELTPNAALADPIGKLTIDTEAEARVPSPARRVSTSDVPPHKENSPRSRNRSAAQ